MTFDNVKEAAGIATALVLGLVVCIFAGIGLMLVALVGIMVKHGEVTILCAAVLILALIVVSI